MFFNKRNRIINKAIAKTVKEFEDRLPKISQHFFYGAVDIAPRNFVIWYLFKTNEELQNAQETGLCDELIETTNKNLLSLGYPKEALENNSFTMLQARVCFTTEEDIDYKTNGDYHLYFQ